MSSAGNFKIEVWKGGYPVWCVIKHGNSQVKIPHYELSDLKYAVDKAMQEAHEELPERYKSEV